MKANAGLAIKTCLATVAVLSAVVATCLILTGCATTTPGEAAGFSYSAYCSLTPEARAAVRAKLDVPHLITCPGDPRGPG